MGLSLAPRRVLASDVGRVWLFTSLIAAASAGVWLVGLPWPSVQTDVSIPWWALAVGFYLAEALVVHLHFRKQAHTLSPSEVPLILGLFLVSPGELLLAQLVGAGLAFALHRRQKPIKVAFNLAEQSLCTGLALLVFHLLGGGQGASLQSWVAALAAAGVAHGAGVLLVSGVISVAEGRFAAPQLGSTMVITLTGAFAAASLGLAAVELVVRNPVALVLLAAPAIACGFAFYRYMAQREQREHFEFLYDSMRATQGAPEFGLAVGQLLAAARRLLRAEYAEILLLTSAPGHPVLRSTSSSVGERLMQPAPLTTALELAFEQVSGADRALFLPRRRTPHEMDGFFGSLGLEDGIVGALRGEDRAFGVLVVGGRVGDVSTFSRGDLQLFETFSRHASILIENGRLEQSLAELTELKEKLRHQAYHDSLTGLPNRLLFAERVTEALEGASAESARHAVLFLDLDRFKEVNDTWGHAMGDELLVMVAERISRTVRPYDTAARLGGDEFAVLLESIDREQAAATAERLAATLGTPFYVGGRELSIHVSVGIAVSGQQASTAEEILRNADIAMYTAKIEDRRHVAFYEPILHKRLRRRRQLVLELEQAVERDEIEVRYQPVVSLADHSLHAFEVLARWQHPTRGELAAGEFIPLAEEAGLIRQLGANVHESALRSAAEWQETLPATAELGLWINLSPRELMEERLVDDLADVLKRNQIDAGRLTFEITESTMIRDERSALRAMSRLRDLGVHLSIDDFGIDYSSLSRLAEFPIEMLKIPKPFVDRLGGDQPSLVDSILHIAGSFGLATCGEGIEHPLQAERLHELGCGHGQGYLFSPPLTADEVTTLLGGEAGRACGVAIAPANVVAL